jgi:type I restriction enzyme, S subunit
MKDGWKEKPLGDIGKVSMCKRILKKQTSENGEIPFYKIGTFGKSPNAYISKEIYEEFRLKYSFPREGDVLISASGTIGRRVIYDGKPAYFQDSNIVWISNDETEVLNEYLYVFYGYCDWNPSIGATISRLYNDDLRNITISFPPLPEQKRIVTILDQAFTAIDKAKANAEKNLANAKELFESYLNGVFGNGNWETKNLNEITDIKDGTHDSPKYIKKGIPFVTQKNIKLDGMSFDDTKFITEAAHEKFYKRSNVTYGDILISMIGANRGMAAIVDDKRVFSIKNVGLIKSSENINAHFLLYYLKAPSAMKYVLYMSNGGAQEFVGLTALRSFPIPYPSLKQQQSIVRQLDTLHAETKKLELIYQNKIIALDELKKSILKKVFDGEL